jgi:DNA-binding MarR family transcriptional regulator
MRANAALRDAHKDVLRDIGLSLSEFDFVAALGNTKGLRMKDLARAMITTPSNVTRVCASMEKKGLAVRERSSESDREVIAKLTVEGEAIFERAFPTLVEFTTETMDSALSERDQGVVADALDHLVSTLRDG